MKKILIIIFLIMAIFQMMVLATAIDIGSAAIVGEECAPSATYINKGVTATGTGKITSVEIFAYLELANCEVATFYVVSGNNLSTRDYETVQIDGQNPGVVPGGSKQTATVDLDVEEGDYIGIYFTSGCIYFNYSGGDGIWHSEGTDEIPADNVAFSPLSDIPMSLYGTGATVEAGNAIFFGMAF